MDRYPYDKYTILLGATRALAHLGTHFTHHVYDLSVQLPPFRTTAFELVQLPALRTTAFELIQKPPLWTTAIELSKCRHSRRRQLPLPKAAVVVAGFYVIQKPAFVLPAIRSIFGIILEPILILFFIFKYTVFSYKTQKKNFKKY